MNIISHIALQKAIYCYPVKYLHPVKYLPKTVQYEFRETNVDLKLD